MASKPTPTLFKTKRLFFLNGVHPEPNSGGSCSICKEPFASTSASASKSRPPTTAPDPNHSAQLPVRIDCPGSHTFCKPCITTWLANAHTCPMDRCALFPEVQPPPSFRLYNVIGGAFIAGGSVEDSPVHLEGPVGTLRQITEEVANGATLKEALLARVEGSSEDMELRSGDGEVYGEVRVVAGLETDRETVKRLWGDRTFAREDTDVVLVFDLMIFVARKDGATRTVLKGFRSSGI